MAVSKEQKEFREFADKIWREFYIAGAALNNLETLAKATVNPALARVLATYEGLFDPASWGFVDLFIIAIENVTSKHSRSPSIRIAFTMLEQTPSLMAGVDVDKLWNRLEKLDPQNKVIQWRQNWSAHRDLKATLPDFKVGELRPIYDAMVQLFHDTCTIPAGHLYTLEVKGADHLDLVIQKLRDV